LSQQDYPSLNDILSIVKTNPNVISKDLANKLFETICKLKKLNLASQINQASKNNTDINFPGLATGANAALAAVMSR
jgi:hypothetical protein